MIYLAPLLICQNVLFCLLGHILLNSNSRLFSARLLVLRQMCLYQVWHFQIPGSHQIKTFKRSSPLRIASSFSLTPTLSGVEWEIGCVENSGTIQNVNLEEEEKSISSRYIAENNLKDQYDLPPTRFEEPIWFHKWNTEIDISKLVNPNVVCPMNQKTTPVENNNGSITSSPLGAPCPGGLWLLQVVRASGRPEY